MVVSPIRIVEIIKVEGKFWTCQMHVMTFLSLNSWYIVKPKSSPKSKSQCQVPNPGPEFKSQIQVPNPKSKVQRKGTGTGADNIILQATTPPPPSFEISSVIFPVLVVYSFGFKSITFLCKHVVTSPKYRYIIKIWIWKILQLMLKNDHLQKIM